MPDRRIIARVIQECWINDWATPTGRVDEIDVTRAVLAMGREQALLLRDNQDETDALVSDTLAMEIAPDEPLCFRVEVADAIRDYFDEKKEK